MVKYRISHNISILNPSDFPEINPLSENLHGHYILLDQNKGKEFLINETVKYFIDKFSNPKTQAEVLQEVALDVQTEEKKIEQKCASFFKFLCRRKIVVPENWVEPKKEKQPLYKEGDCFDNLLVLEIISNKDYVDIYLVQNKVTATKYVVKLLNQKKISDKTKYKEELLDLEHEYQMLQKIKHIPSICQAYTFRKDSDQNAYILLEYIKGKPLSRFLKQVDTLTLHDCLTIIHNILQAFSMLHESHLIHGDIHPSNIMVNDDKSIKIIDLGFSFEVTIEADEVLKFGGVLYYMPPERINTTSLHKFSKEPDYYSDVYQIGLILYFIFYQKEPFIGFIWEEFSENIKRKEVMYPTLSIFNFRVSEQIIQIIENCLQKKPSRRYATATSLLKEFKKVALENEALIF
ncbi:serine/threonine-protein kinase [Adhaeribacter radiodurans]|uniref:Serine/threonine protein kinase n=1 Tax=Adhaeribacter radiodurans TaxID=2745197 RepID=A0A7L7LC88_9BACT|nr:serine/threonine-protein kinase [Adhaeribacter radiodurans]QMU30460.1 serine/threonine protein kinase [Adhaeribacter radiodurans]